MWNMKFLVIPAFIGAMGIVAKGPKISGNNRRKASSTFCTKNNRSGV
jgi:hypothetical protein